MLNGRGVRFRASTARLAPARGRTIRRLLERRGIHFERVLDVGCGDGGVLTGLADETTLAAAVDVDWLSLQVAARVLGERTLAVRADATRLPFRNGSFDVVVIYDVLEHVRMWRGIFTETARVLRPGGTAYVTAVNARSPVTIVDEPHWHLPLLAVLPPGWSEAILRRLDPAGLQMGGDFPSFPSWKELHDAASASGLQLELVGMRAKLLDPESILAPWKRRLARWLKVLTMFDGALSSLFHVWDRSLARSWTFLARKTR